ncbi:hypothetical protein T06_9608 [Trichinella sp. T6]|nr:hypothetical protein T06_9608 [Trichinella sp. T6]
MASAAGAKSKKEEITVSLNGLLEELDELCTPSLTQTKEDGMEGAMEDWSQYRKTFRRRRAAACALIHQLRKEQE